MDALQYETETEIFCVMKQYSRSFLFLLRNGKRNTYFLGITGVDTHDGKRLDHCQ